MQITYKHEKGECNATYEMIVEHNKIIYFICPQCKTMSGFIPTTDYCEETGFELNKFKPVNSELFTAMKKPVRKRKGSKSTTNTKRKSTRKKKPEKQQVGCMIYSFPYKVKLALLNKPKQ